MSKNKLEKGDLIKQKHPCWRDFPDATAYGIYIGNGLVYWFNQACENCSKNWDNKNERTGRKNVNKCWISLDSLEKIL